MITYSKYWNCSSFNQNCFHQNNLELGAFLYIEYLSITEIFYTLHYLNCCTLSAVTRTVLNETKWKCGQDAAKFAGLKITPSWTSPSDKLLSAIKNSPIPTKFGQWFGLVSLLCNPLKNLLNIMFHLLGTIILTKFSSVLKISLLVKFKKIFIHSILNDIPALKPI